MHAAFIPVFPEDDPNSMLHDWPQDIIFLNDLPSNHKFHKFRGQAKGMKAVLEPDLAKGHKGSHALLNALAQSAAAQSPLNVNDAEDKNTTPEDNQTPDISAIAFLKQ